MKMVSISEDQSKPISQLQILDQKDRNKIYFDLQKLKIHLMKNTK